MCNSMKMGIAEFWSREGREVRGVCWECGGWGGRRRVEIDGEWGRERVFRGGEGLEVLMLLMLEGTVGFGGGMVMVVDEEWL